MIINKITVGFVIQAYDTELGRFVSQDFIASGQCDYEDEDGQPVNPEEMGDPEPYLPYSMMPPGMSITKRAHGEDANQQ